MVHLILVLERVRFKKKNDFKVPNIVKFFPVVGSLLFSVGACGEGVAVGPHWAGVPQTTHRSRDFDDDDDGDVGVGDDDGDVGGDDDGDVGGDDDGDVLVMMMVVVAIGVRTLDNTHNT